MWSISTSYFSTPILVILHKVLVTLPKSVDKIGQIGQMPPICPAFCPILSSLRALRAENTLWKSSLDKWKILSSNLSNGSQPWCDAISTSVEDPKLDKWTKFWPFILYIFFFFGFYLYKNKVKFCPFVQHPWFYWIMREIFVQLSSKFCPLLINLSNTPDFTGFYTRYFLIFSYAYHYISSNMMLFWPLISSTNPVKSGAVDKILTVCPNCPDLGHFHPFSCPNCPIWGFWWEFDEKMHDWFVQSWDMLSNPLSIHLSNPLSTTIQNSRKKVITCTTKWLNSPN